MTTKQMPAWLTRLLALVLFAATYVVHKEGFIPPTLEWFHVNVLGALNTIVLALGSIGLSGPALWPQLAALLGNPSAGKINDAAKAVGAPVPTATKGPTP